jgi:hypothetical protein
MVLLPKIPKNSSVDNKSNGNKNNTIDKRGKKSKYFKYESIIYNKYEYYVPCGKYRLARGPYWWYNPEEALSSWALKRVVIDRKKKREKTSLTVVLTPGSLGL